MTVPIYQTGNGYPQNRVDFGIDADPFLLLPCLTFSFTFGKTVVRFLKRTPTTTNK